MRGRGLLFGLILLFSSAPAKAEPTQRDAAKESFKAGAMAYAAGDYLAAIQALDAAYRLTPLPAIAFSLAQAERRQYFVSREPSHLLRARELYRRYLVEVPVGGRRADAIDALAQLEPLAASPAGLASAPAGTLEPVKTRLMVSSAAPRAGVSLDGAPAVESPLIAEVTPGPHRVRVQAEGFFPADRPVVAVPGALVPMEISLEEVPSRVRLQAPPQAELYVDGRSHGKVGSRGEFVLPSGHHTFSLALNGYRLATLSAELERGQTQTLRPKLKPTVQRSASVVLFGVGGAALATGITFAALAVRQENQASEILTEQNTANISADELHEYEESVRRRDQFRAVSAIGFTASVVSLVTALLLYQFDEPSVHEQQPAGDRAKRALRPSIALVHPSAGEGIAARVNF